MQFEAALWLNYLPFLTFLLGWISQMRSSVVNEWDVEQCLLYDVPKC